MAGSSAVKLEAKDFGDFTRERIVSILKKSLDIKPTVVAPLAALVLASIDPHGPRPDSAVIDTALDVLSGSPTPLARDLLWQAAEHAKNARIRIEAIRRCGPIAMPERAALLRKWAMEGFQPAATFQQDSVNINSIREAALQALGAMSDPAPEDIDVLIAAMTPPPNQETSPPIVFTAACNAYWLAGDAVSLPKLVGLATRGWRIDIGASLLALTAKFSASQLKPHAEALRKAFLEYPGEWPNDSVRADRLVMLAEKLFTPEFFQDWASRHGGDGLEHGRGRVSLKLLEGFAQPAEGFAKGLLTLARWPQHLRADGPVLRGLRNCVGAGHERLVAQTIVAAGNEGHRQLIESGHVFALYDSADAALTSICGAISTRRNEQDRQRIAASVADGALVAACADGLLDPRAKTITRGGQGQKAREDREALVDKVRLIETLDPSQNPVAVAARLLCPPTSSSGAWAVCQCWLKRGEDLAQYVVRMALREAGQANALGQEAPMLAHFEQCLLPSEPQQAAMRAALVAALPLEILVDGRLNRYALDLMQRAKLSFEKVAGIASDGIQTEDDAQFLLDRLHTEGAVELLTKSTRFHRPGQEQLQKHVQATAIRLATDLLKQANDKKRQDAFAGQLHERFQDLPMVRESAYRACGELGSFLSIKPLRARLPKETSSSARVTIEQAICVLRTRLIEEKPQQGTADSIRLWLGFVTDLGDPALVPYVVGYLAPPHTDHSVRHSALIAIEHMPGPESLEVVKKFIDDTAPEGQTLKVARHARLVLEERTDSDLFDVLSSLYAADEEVLDPATDYVKLLGTSLMSITKGLKKSLELLNDGHWDEFVTRISGVMESVTHLVFRRRFDVLGIDENKAKTIARGPYASVLNFTPFRNAYGKLQSHCSTIYAYRGESPTAHATKTDGSAKAEMNSDDAEYVRDEFKLAFAEAVRVLR